MSTHVLKRRTMDPIDLLERMLNNTALSTKKVTHNDVLVMGEDVLRKTYVDVDSMKALAVKEALRETERRHMKELKASLQRQQKQLDDEHKRQLNRLKRFHDDLARRVAEQRDKAEEERVRQLTMKFDKMREEALRKQWEECQRLQAEAIEQACEQLTTKLRNQFALDREKAIADALTKAREKFRIREQETIERTRRECEAESAAEAARVAKIHQDTVNTLQNRIHELERRLHEETCYRKAVEHDFSELQTDYKRFMDYTDTGFHSDYMMRIRRHGTRLAQHRPKTSAAIVRVEDITPLKS